MAISQFIFYLVAATIMTFSLLFLFSRKILRAATHLLVVLLSTAGLYFLLHYEFLAGVQLMVYAGGIVVLIIFSILLTSHVKAKTPMPKPLNIIGGASVAVIGLTLTTIAIFNTTFTATTNAAMDVDMRQIGLHLLSTEKNGYALPFEVISILLLSAMIASILIAKRNN